MDIRSLLAALKRERWIILSILTLALLAGVASIMLTPKTYEAAAVIQVEQQAPATLAPGESPQPNRAEADRALKTEVDLIGSRAIAQATVRELKLDSNPEFLRLAKAEVTDPAQVRLAAATNRVQAGTAIDSPLESRIIQVRYQDRDPQRAALVVNKLVDTAMRSTTERRLAASTYAKNYLSDQIASSKRRLESSERALIAYSRASGFVDASGAVGTGDVNNAGGSLTTANLVDINNAYSQARSNRLQAQQRWQTAQATPVMSLPEVLSNPAVQELTRNRAELQATLQEQQQRYQDQHPQVQETRSRLGEIERQLGAVAGSIRNSIGNQYQVAARQESALASSVSQLKSSTLTEQSKGVRYNAIKRDVDKERDLLSNLLQRFNVLSSSAGLGTNPISVVDRAVPPSSPVSPKPVVNMVLAGFSGLVLGLLFAFGRERMRDTIHAPGEIERDTGLPLLGLVPVLPHGESITTALQNPLSPLNEAHHAITASVDRQVELVEHSILLITSSRPGEGKSTTALKIASNMAQAGRKVLLVDGDMRRGSLHRLLGVPNDHGLASLLTEGSSEQAIRRTEVPNLDFISRGRARQSPAALLASERLPAFLDQMRRRYDIVVIDAPPVLGLADTPRLAGAADATLFVLQAHLARKEEARIALRRLLNAGANIAGVVMTKFDPSKAGGGYAYAYSYDYAPDAADEEDDERARAAASTRVTEPAD
jgi:capsular exopolysaccharide synthesis family protein